MDRYQTETQEGLAGAHYRLQTSAQLCNIPSASGMKFQHRLGDHLLCSHYLQREWVPVRISCRAICFRGRFAQGLLHRLCRRRAPEGLVVQNKEIALPPAFARTL